MTQSGCGGRAAAVVQRGRCGPRGTQVGPVGALRWQPSSGARRDCRPYIAFISREYRRLMLPCSLFNKGRCLGNIAILLEVVIDP